jgi:chemotaxis methyl-accepting protein methylase/PAS domain-containing protein
MFMKKPILQVKIKTPPSEREPASPAQPAFPVVGIGASAGGLEALEQFLKNVPPGSGVAYVIIQHLDPTHKGIMPELLQRATVMEVSQVADRMRVKRDCVYVIPPNKDMSILHGVLHLFEPAAPRGLRLPIDFFLRSLADDCKERAIGVILSGMGSDGTMGLRGIKEKAGLVLVQDPASAKFDSMPRSAIDAGLADIVAPVEELPGKIVAYLQHALHITKTEPALELKDQSALEKVLILLRSKTGHDFSMYKKSTVYRRIERRMGIHQIDKIALYARYLQANPQEVELLFNELLIGVTSFFRDPSAWQQLRDEAIPALFGAYPAGGVLRAWSVGCSTGEEAYSLAMVFKEALEQVKPRGSFSLQIFATDLDAASIGLARQGRYPANISADVSPERLRRFFIEGEGCYRVGKEIRDMVTFATQNVIMDPPFTKLDILVCRNLLIYLVPELQKKLLPLFHYSLHPGGVLFLGSAETIGNFSELFAPLHAKSRIYRRGPLLLRGEPVSFPSSFLSTLPHQTKESTMPKPALNLQSLADQLLLQNYAPPAVLTNDQGDIVYISGRTGKYLEPAAGKANWNIFAMAREGLRFELSSAFQKAARQSGAVTVRGAKVGTNGGSQLVDVTAQRIESPESLQGMVMIVFHDVAATAESRSAGRGKSTSVAGVRIAELEQELGQSREEMRSTREEMQTSQEELKSANEELQSTNEELQSTNEELTTSKEEMQSMNEELQAVNAEQQARVDELSRMSSDMKNLLNSTEIVTVFLDNDLKVRRFTTGANQLFKLIPGDVGRPLSDIASDLSYAGLLDDAREVLRTLVFSEKPISAADGRWFNVRIMPYRTLENVIDGVVITFADVSAAKTLEARLQERERETRSLIDSMLHGFAVLELVGGGAGEPGEPGAPGDYRFLSVNPAFERLFGLSEAELTGRSLQQALPRLAKILFDACREVALSGDPAFFQTQEPGSDRELEITLYRPAPGRLVCQVADSAWRRQSPSYPVPLKKRE